MIISNLFSLRGSAAAAALMIFAAPAVAQTPRNDSGPDAIPAADADTDARKSDTVVVTGTRIRRTDTTTTAPVTVFTSEDLAERGFNQVGEMLNQITSNTPSVPTPPFNGVPVLNQGRHSPNLFNLGAGRTLTLVNGRRTVTSSSGLQDRVVDSNAIPTGLIQRVDVVQAGGAAVYGSDAIAGVVNYILMKDFEGLEIDASYGLSSRSDNERNALVLTAGTNFDNDRGNIATNLEWSRTYPLLQGDRPATARSLRATANPLNTGPNDGQPPIFYFENGRYWDYSRNGVIFSANSGDLGSLLQVNGSPVQFSRDGGRVIPYNTGIAYPDTQSSGGDGVDQNELSSLTAGVDRYSATLLSHYDLTNDITASAEFVFGREEATDPIGTQSIARFIGGFPPSGQGPIFFNRNNPFLSTEARATLDAASPAFAGGGNLVLGRFMDVLPTRTASTETTSWRLLAALDGELNFMDRDFYWSVSASHAEAVGDNHVWAPYTAHLQAALSAVQSGGQIVCSINADGNPANDDPACVPINPFGDKTATREASAYVSAQSGAKYVNVQEDILATIGGDLITLPAGKAQFSLAFENRYEGTKFDPYEANREGWLFSGIKSAREQASYRTNEFSGELLVPIVGGDFKLPFVKELELSGSYRFVDHSVSGEEEVWGSGLRWNVGYGLTLRGSKSRNFRAPTLSQQFAPVSESISFLGQDPCDADRINGGPASGIRRANCEAEWAANPTYAPLAGFQDPAENTSIVSVRTGGNPDLRNEVSDTLTYGIVFEPQFLPGVTMSIDSIDIDLAAAIVNFTPATFLAQCYDRTPQPADACSTFTRHPNGTVATARSTTFNAGALQYKGEIYNVNYRFELADLFGGADLGKIDLGIEATNTRLLATGTGTATNHTEGTTGTPDWRTRFDARYSYGPFRLFYSLYYLPEVKSGFYDTIETTPYPIIGSNTTQTLSGQFEFENFTLRAGVNNLTDEQPSYPTTGYGDLYGRQFFIGLNAKY